MLNMFTNKINESCNEKLVSSVYKQILEFDDSKCNVKLPFKEDTELLSDNYEWAISRLFVLR